MLEVRQKGRHYANRGCHLMCWLHNISFVETLKLVKYLWTKIQNLDGICDFGWTEMRFWTACLFSPYACLLELLDRHHQRANGTCMLSPSWHTRGGSTILMSTPTVQWRSTYCTEPMPPAAPLTWCSWIGSVMLVWRRQRISVKVTSPLRMSKSHVITHPFCATCTRTYNICCTLYMPVWVTVPLSIPTQSPSYRLIFRDTTAVEICHWSTGKGTVHSYGVSLAIWDHTVLPATRHKWTHPTLTAAIQAGTRFTYPGGMEGWVDLVYLIAPQLGVEPATFRLRVQCSTTVPPRQNHLPLPKERRRRGLYSTNMIK